jgi:hypothetical protein
MTGMNPPPPRHTTKPELDPDERADTDCCCGSGDYCPCDADGPDGMCECCRDGDHNGRCAGEKPAAAGRGAADGDTPSLADALKASLKRGAADGTPQ